MSFLTRTAFRSVPKFHAYRVIAVNSRRAFHITGVRPALSESDQNREGVAKEIDHHNKDQLNKQKEGKGHWKRELASNSESAVKADRGDIDASEDEIKRLQKETEEYHAEGREVDK
ncbi:hypothetical protein MMC08_001607 [Hypocenomyce scalaris]|nr:hypothetical protein [Hypocenomyce scalaris]